MNSKRLIIFIDHFILSCFCIFVLFLPIAHTETIRAFSFGLPAGLWIIKMILERRWLFAKTTLDLPIFLFSVVASLSLLTAVDFKYSLEEYFGEWLTGIFLFYLVLNNIREGQIKWVLGALFIGNILMAIYGIGDFFHSGGSFWDYKIRAKSLHSGFYTFAAYLVTTIPYLVIAFIHAKRTAYRLALIILLFINFLALFITHTRGAWVAVTVLILLVGWKFMSRKLFFTFAPMASIAFFLLFPSKILQHTTNIVISPEKNSSIETFQARWEVTKFVLQKIAENPFQMIGYGQRSFVKKYPEFDERYKGAQLWHPHNTFLAIALSTGVQGLAIFVFFLYRLLKFLHSKSELETIPLRKFYYLGTFMMVISFFVINLAADFFIDDSALLFWFLCGMAFTLNGELERPRI